MMDVANLYFILFLGTAALNVVMILGAELQYSGSLALLKSVSAWI